MKYIIIILLLITIGCEFVDEVPSNYEKVVKGMTVEVHVQDNFFNGTRFYTMFDFQDMGIKTMTSKRTLTVSGYNIECVFTDEKSYNRFKNSIRLDIVTFNRNCKLISKIK